MNSVVKNIALIGTVVVADGLGVGFEVGLGFTDYRLPITVLPYSPFRCPDQDCFNTLLPS